MSEKTRVKIFTEKDFFCNNFKPFCGSSDLGDKINSFIEKKVSKIISIDTRCSNAAVEVYGGRYPYLIIVTIVYEPKTKENKSL